MFNFFLEENKEKKVSNLLVISLLDFKKNIELSSMYEFLDFNTLNLSFNQDKVILTGDASDFARAFANQFLQDSEEVAVRASVKFGEDFYFDNMLIDFEVRIKEAFENETWEELSNDLLSFYQDMEDRLEDEVIKL